MVSEIVSLISLSDLPLWMYGNAIDFCMLILYPATLPHSLMCSRSFLVASLGFSMYESLSVMSDSLWPHRLYSPWNSPGRILEWVAVPFSRGFSQPRDQTQVSHIVGKFFTSWATREANIVLCHLQIVTVLPLFQFEFFFFISLSFLTAMARTSKTALSKSGKCGHPCLVPDLGGNVLSMMFTVGLS